MVYSEECLYTGDDSTCSPSEKTSDGEAGQSQRDGPEGDHGLAIDVTAVSHYDFYSLQELRRMDRVRDGNHLHGAI